VSAFFTWFMGTKIGRGIAFGTAFVVIAVVAYWRIFTAGRRSQQAAQDRQSLENHRVRQEVSDDVASRSDDQRRRELSRWVQPD